MKITFLGTGGGRFSAISQRRMTGGFRIDNLNGKNYHVDPGPGALVRTYQFGFDPRNLDGVFVSHAHTDHYNDAEILIEAMTRGMTKEYGVVMKDGVREFQNIIKATLKNMFWSQIRLKTLTDVLLKVQKQCMVILKV